MSIRADDARAMPPSFRKPNGPRLLRGLTYLGRALLFPLYSAADAGMSSHVLAGKQAPYISSIKAQAAVEVELLGLIAGIGLGGLQQIVIMPDMVRLVGNYAAFVALFLALWPSLPVWKWREHQDQALQFVFATSLGSAAVLYQLVDALASVIPWYISTGGIVAAWLIAFQQGSRSLKGNSIEFE
jgi:hypothetical protein